MQIGRFRSHLSDAMPTSEADGIHSSAVLAMRESILKWVPHPIGPLGPEPLEYSQPLVFRLPVLGIRSEPSELWLAGTNVALPAANVEDATKLLESINEVGVVDAHLRGFERDLLDDLAALGIVANS